MLLGKEGSTRARGRSYWPRSRAGPIRSSPGPCGTFFTQKHSSLQNGLENRSSRSGPLACRPSSPTHGTGSSQSTLAANVRERSGFHQRGFRYPDTEILAGGNQTFPEHLLPKSIDLNPCREWVMRGDKPMGQIETIDSRVRFGGMNAFG